MGVWVARHGYRYLAQVSEGGDIANFERRSMHWARVVGARPDAP